MKSFSDFDFVREQLLDRAGRLEALWLDVRRFQDRTEGLAVHARDSEDADVVQDAIEQIRRRLEQSVLEIGVFGEVKRGKSTLLNALLGMEVSSTRVTPETAVPVWVERGSGDALVIYADGRIEEVDDPQTARERMTQRFRKLRPKDPVARVVQRVDVDWLPDGVRIIDTPGLADPSLSQDYEDLTLAELDRVAAAVFVFVSPPGIARDENRLLQSLAERGIEKAFLVCNFFADHWADEAIRSNVADTIRHAVQSHGDDAELLEDKVRVFEVNAKQGLVAALEDDEVGLQDSGVAALRAELERYLSETAMHRLAAKSESLLDRARATVVSVLERRMAALSDRSELEEAQRRLSVEVRESRDALNAIEDRCVTDITALRGRLETIVAEPFDEADRLISKAASTEDLEGVSHKLRLASETAASRASTTYRNEVAVLEERMRRHLFDSFGVDEGLRTSRTVDVLPAAADVSVGAIEGGPDPGSIALGAGLAGTAGALAGGSLAGGLGIALIASGPVGWLIGAGLGLLAGGAVGGHAGAALSRGSLSPQAREDLREQVDRSRRRALEEVGDLSARVRDELLGSLSRQQDRFFGQRQAELLRIEEILSDDRRVGDALEHARDLKVQVEKL